MAKLSCLRSYFFVSFTALLVGSASGCGGSQTSDSITISISSQMVSAGETAQLQAVDKNSVTGPSSVTGSVTWASSNTSVATVSASGLLTGVSSGDAIISAISKKATRSLSVTINKAVIIKLTLDPQRAAVFTGDEQQFYALATFSDGTTRDITSQVARSATSAGVATIGTSGLLDAIASGNYTVTATSGNVTATAAGTLSSA